MVSLSPPSTTYRVKDLKDSDQLVSSNFFQC